MWKMLAKARRLRREEAQVQECRNLRSHCGVLKVCCWKHKAFCTKSTKNLLRTRMFLTPKSFRRQSQFWLLSIKCIFLGRGGFLKTSPLHKGPWKTWKTKWWFQIFLFSSIFGERTNFDYYVSNGFKPPTRKWCSFLFTRVVFWLRSITKQFWVGELSLNKLDSWRLWSRNSKQPKK